MHTQSLLSYSDSAVVGDRLLLEQQLLVYLLMQGSCRRLENGNGIGCVLIWTAELRTITLLQAGVLCTTLRCALLRCALLRCALLRCGPHSARTLPGTRDRLQTSLRHFRRLPCWFLVALLDPVALLES